MFLKPMMATVVALGLALPAMAQEREFRLGLITPPVHVWNKEVDAMSETLKERSDGRFSITAFPSGQLGNESAMLQQLQTGALDMAWLTTAELTFRVPDMAALHAPFLVDNIEDAARVLRSDEAREILDTLPAATGTVGVCYAMIGMRQMVLRENIDSAADLSGKRIRITPAPAISTFFEMFGAAPAPMPLPAIYDSLANGQIDGLDMDYESIINFRYYEHAPHILETNHHMFGMVALISAPVWATLSEEDRALISEVTQMHCDRTIDRFVTEEDKKLASLREVPGIQITEDVGQDFFGDIVERWDAEWGAKTSYVARLRELVASF
ncbi:TRAP transporter substrate-binding protein [Roseovarius sp.]|jgi:TRAP-type C4-dicarboxylate transport system substrate-binding protein